MAFEFKDVFFSLKFQKMFYSKTSPLTYVYHVAILSKSKVVISYSYIMNFVGFFFGLKNKTSIVCMRTVKIYGVVFCLSRSALFRKNDILIS